MTASSARLDLRLSAADKARISRAAAMRGLPVSVFVRQAVLREADLAAAAEGVSTLSPEESRRFLAALDRPFEATERLARAQAAAAALAQPD